MANITEMLPSLSVRLWGVPKHFVACTVTRLRLGALPNEFSYATALTRLDVSRNRLQYLPLDFGQLFSLRVSVRACLPFACRGAD